MSLKLYLVTMTGTTLICLGSLGFIINNIDPKSTNLVGFSLFYASLFLSLLGIFSIIGFITRFLALKQELIKKSVLVAFRQASLISFLVVLILLLLSKDLFSWTNSLLLVAGLSMLEFFLIGYENDHKD